MTLAAAEPRSGLRRQPGRAAKREAAHKTANRQVWLHDVFSPVRGGRFVAHGGSHGSKCMVLVPSPGEAIRSVLLRPTMRNRVPPLPGLHSLVTILPAVDTAGYKPFAAPRLHHKTRTPPSAGSPPILGCIQVGSLSALDYCQSDPVWLEFAAA